MLELEMEAVEKRPCHATTQAACGEEFGSLISHTLDDYTRDLHASGNRPRMALYWRCYNVLPKSVRASAYPILQFGPSIAPKLKCLDGLALGQRGDWHRSH